MKNPMAKVEHCLSSYWAPYSVSCGSAFLSSCALTLGRCVAGLWIDPTGGKVSWRGRAVAVQPRSRLMQSFDERQHAYLGYVLTIEGTIEGGVEERFQVAVGTGAHAKHLFRVGDEMSGVSASVEDPRGQHAGMIECMGAN